VTRVNTGNDQPVTLVRQAFTMRHLRGLRHLVMRAARRAGLDRQRTQNLVVAVNEAAGNAIKHAGGRGQLDVIQDDQRQLIAEISDQGPGLPPDVSITLPPPDAIGGRGLWLMHEVCDHVEFWTSRAGTTVRLGMRLQTG
jgi:serine/threonine-protein kinase RsbW